MRLSVLLVDDEPNLLAGLKRALNRRYEVHTAGNAAQALATLTAADIDVVVSDECMPGMDGIELLAEAARRWPSTLRIMLTGQQDFDTVINAVNRGNIHRFLSKPCSTELLISAIEQVAKQRELEQVGRRLLHVARTQQSILENIERLDPGITQVARDTTGAVLVEDMSNEDLDALIEEMRQITEAP